MVTRECETAVCAEPRCLYLEAVVDGSQRSQRRCSGGDNESHLFSSSKCGASRETEWESNTGESVSCMVGTTRLGSMAWVGNRRAF